MQNEFEPQRADLTSELTALVLAGGEIAKVRDKLSKLEARETDFREAEANYYRQLASQSSMVAA